MEYQIVRFYERYGWEFLCIIATIAAIQEGYYTIYKNDK